jgi:hypothetical protein
LDLAKRCRSGLPALPPRSHSAASSPLAAACSTLCSGSVAASLMFYFVTNTDAWVRDPALT